MNHDELEQRERELKRQLDALEISPKQQHKADDTHWALLVVGLCLIGVAILAYLYFIGAGQ